MLASDLVKRGEMFKDLFGFFEWSRKWSHGEGAGLGRDGTWLEGREEAGMCRGTEIFLCLFWGPPHFQMG